MASGARSLKYWVLGHSALSIVGFFEVRENKTPAIGLVSDAIAGHLIRTVAKRDLFFVSPGQI